MNFQTSPKAKPWLLLAIVFVLCFDTAWLWQRYVGAHNSEFGGHPDEAGHYVTGLFVRDAVTTLPKCATEKSVAPLKTHINQKDPAGFYTHYPKVALGVWPPVFYLTQTAWTLAFGVERPVMLALMCALAATLGALIYIALRRPAGDWAAAAAALACLSLPLVREYYSMVMAETLSAVLMFAATLALADFLEKQRRWSAILFGVCAGLAIMTKGTGLALALSSGLAIVLSAQWRLLKNPWLWIGGLLTAIIAGPWTFIFRNEGRAKGGWEYDHITMQFTGKAIPYYAEKILYGLGPFLLLLAALGLWSCVFRANERRVWWTTIAALIPGVYLFQIIMPVGYEDRHLIPALPAAVVLAVGGICWLARGLSARLGEKAAPFALGVIVLLIGAVQTYGQIHFQTIPSWRAHKTFHGMLPAVQSIIGLPRMEKAVILVSSDATGEGMFISELAMRDQRPGRTVRRATKELGTSKWNGSAYEAKFRSEPELLDHILKENYDFIVLDESMPDNKRGLHSDQLRHVAEQNPQYFWPILSTPITRGGEECATRLQVYRVMRKNAFQ